MGERHVTAQLPTLVTTAAAGYAVRACISSCLQGGVVHTCSIRESLRLGGRKRSYFGLEETWSCRVMSSLLALVQAYNQEELPRARRAMRLVGGAGCERRKLVRC